MNVISNIYDETQEADCVREERTTESSRESVGIEQSEDSLALLYWLDCT